MGSMIRCVELYYGLGGRVEFYYCLLRSTTVYPGLLRSGSAYELFLLIIGQNSVHKQYVCMNISFRILRADLKGWIEAGPKSEHQMILLKFIYKHINAKFICISS